MYLIVGFGTVGRIKLLYTLCKGGNIKASALLSKNDPTDGIGSESFGCKASIAVGSVSANNWFSYGLQIGSLSLSKIEFGLSKWGGIIIRLECCEN